ncbi:hypothetical protein BDV19DRAFT_352196 [Aspergillus venezuelensis]
MYDHRTGRSRGAAFADFYDEREADEAVERLDRTVYVLFFSFFGFSEAPTDYCVVGCSGARSICVMRVIWLIGMGGGTRGLIMRGVL